MRVVDAVSGADRHFSVGGRIPCQSDSWTEEPFGVVFCKRRGSNPWFGQEHTLSIGDKVGGPSRNFIPARVEFVAKANTECEVVSELHGVVDVPCAQPASPSNLRWVWRNLKINHDALQERLQTRESRLSLRARSRVIVSAFRLNPCTIR